MAVDSGIVRPAEWSRHAATWVAWPRHRGDWPAWLKEAQREHCGLVREIAKGEEVRLLVNTSREENEARLMLTLAGADLRRIRFVRRLTERPWLRDSGPIFVRHAGCKIALRFRFNGWARDRDHARDAALVKGLARYYGWRMCTVRHKGRIVVLEGGSIDTNGRGDLLTTEECLLSHRVQVRNRGFERADYEEIFRRYLGVRNVVWLNRGLSGDDTHGHVDDLCRFIGPRTILLAHEKNRRDRNCRILAENRERLADARLADGSRPCVVDLPMPAPIRYRCWRLPASYANFYMANAAVIMPLFDDPNDLKAIGIVRELVKDRPVVGVPARHLLLGGGALHCLTQEEPV